MKITDEALFAAAPKACEQWLSGYPEDCPKHQFSAQFEDKMAVLMRKERKRPPLRFMLIAAILTVLMFTVGTFAAESDWISEKFHSTLPPVDGADYSITLSKDIEPVSEEHLALHELPDTPELWEYVSSLDLYIGDAHPVDGHYSCEKHGNDSHFVSVSEKLTVQRSTCALCGHKELSFGISTIETCLTEPDLDDYTFCSSHEACEPFGKTAADFEGWMIVTETEYTEWEENRSTDTKRVSPCTVHNHFAHDQVEQVRYAITEYQCPDCPKIVPFVERQTRTVCYALTEGLTYAAEPLY